MPVCVRFPSCTSACFSLSFLSSFYLSTHTSWLLHVLCLLCGQTLHRSVKHSLTLLRISSNDDDHHHHHPAPEAARASRPWRWRTRVRAHPVSHVRACKLPVLLIRIDASARAARHRVAAVSQSARFCKLAALAFFSYWQRQRSSLKDLHRGPQRDTSKLGSPRKERRVRRVHAHPWRSYGVAGWVRRKGRLGAAGNGRVQDRSFRKVCSSCCRSPNKGLSVLCPGMVGPLAQGTFLSPVVIRLALVTNG